MKKKTLTAKSVKLTSRGTVEFWDYDRQRVQLDLTLSSIGTARDLAKVCKEWIRHQKAKKKRPARHE